MRSQYVFDLSSYNFCFVDIQSGNHLNSSQPYPNSDYKFVNTPYVFCTVYLFLTLPVNLGFIMTAYCSHESLLKCLGQSWAFSSATFI